MCLLQDRVDLIAVGISPDGGADDPLSLALPAHDAPEGEVRQVPGRRNRRRILEFLEQALPCALAQFGVDVEDTRPLRLVELDRAVENVAEDDGPLASG